MNNRIIKFRVWHKSGNRFIDLNGFFIWFSTHPDKGQVYAATEQGIVREYEIEDISIMQYTGLKDKNGKEIYEGDILQFGYPTTSKYDPDDDTYRLPIKVIISFHGGAFWFTGEGYTDCNWHFYNAEYREVIGNIYTNPDLIQK